MRLTPVLSHCQKRHQHGHRRERSLSLAIRKLTGVSAYDVFGRHTCVSESIGDA
jgi:hypothetical protein